MAETTWQHPTVPEQDSVCPASMDSYGDEILSFAGDRAAKQLFPKKQRQSSHSLSHTAKAAKAVQEGKNKEL